MTNWHTVETDEVLRLLNTNVTNGLDAAEVHKRQIEYGRNELIERGRKSTWQIAWEQLTATMVLILIVAALVSLLLGDYKDAVVILAIVILNAILGFTQEHRAERAMAALKQLAAPIVRVRRDGHIQEIPSHALVPGDLVLLEAGNFVPADGRILESVNLRIQEAALTGESEAVDKETTLLTKANLPLGDRHNMAYMGTIATYGRGQLVVTDIGMKTELGAIATLMQTMKQETTPLQRRLDQLGRTLAGVALAIVAIIFVLGLLRGEEFRLMFLTAVSMAVAAVPEGLPAVVTIALALGAQRMLKRRALIRKLAAVETLGSVTVICSDKTGTLTENRMTVTVLDVAGQRLDLTGPLENDKNQFALPPLPPAFILLLVGGALCNDAQIERNGDGLEENRLIGDPTEGALLMVAERHGLSKAQINAAFPRIAELPFDSIRKRMTTMHIAPLHGAPLHGAPFPHPDFLQPAEACEGMFGETGARFVAFTKGAVDKLLEASSQVWNNGVIEPLNADWRARIVAANDRLAGDGMRVLGVAFEPLHATPSNGHTDRLEQNLIFIGLLGMIDPARPEVRAAVQTCMSAGIRPIMITGDHPLTAQAIARELGIDNAGRVLTGQDLERMSVEELKNSVDSVAVYARVSPEHKLKIVEALQARGHIVAMTGDGVNDAPALKKADIGVAMGITGTDVTKEAADMVLQDDNFATIVAAVEEGRVIYDNIRKFIKFLMATNTGELWVMFLAPLAGMPLPLLPLQILWVNLVTDGLPALALSVEPPERDIMQRPPYPPKEGILSRGLGWQILWVGLLIGLVTLGIGYWYWATGVARWQTMVFLTITLTQMAQVLGVRSEHDSLFRIGLTSNKPLLGAILLTFGLTLAVIYTPFLQQFFTTAPLTAGDLLISLGASSLIFWAMELEKMTR